MKRYKNIEVLVLPADQILLNLLSVAISYHTTEYAERGNNMPVQDYTSSSIPETLYDTIDKFIRENVHLGFTSVPDFIRESIRLHIWSIKDYDNWY